MSRIGKRVLNIPENVRFLFKLLSYFLLVFPVPYVYDTLPFCSNPYIFSKETPKNFLKSSLFTLVL